MNIVIDTNVFISALIKPGLTRKLIVNCKHNLLFPEFELLEIKKHKFEIIEKSRLSEKEFNILLLRLLNYVKIVPSDIVIDYNKEAFDVIGNVDKDDVIFIATALAFNCSVWSDDEHFQKQARVRIFRTSEMV